MYKNLNMLKAQTFNELGDICSRTGKYIKAVRFYRKADDEILKLRLLKLARTIRTNCVGKKLEDIYIYMGIKMDENITKFDDEILRLRLLKLERTIRANCVGKKLDDIAFATRKAFATLIFKKYRSIRDFIYKNETNFYILTDKKKCATAYRTLCNYLFCLQAQKDGSISNMSGKSALLFEKITDGAIPRHRLAPEIFEPKLFEKLWQIIKDELDYDEQLI